MNKVEPISFWTPIVPHVSVQTTTKEWLRSQADQLLSFGHHIYRLDANDVVRLEDAPVRSNWETAKKVILLATLILPVAALIVKMIDRYTHQYKLFVPTPLSTISKQPSPKKEIVDEKKAPVATSVNQQEAAPPSKLPETPPLSLPVQDQTESLTTQSQKPQEEKEPIQQATPLVVDPQTITPHPVIAPAPQIAQAALPATQPAQPDPSLQTQKDAKAKADQLQKDIDDKLAAEEQKKKLIEHNRACHKVAELFFPKMLDLFYDQDGELNNELGKDQAYNNFWGMQKDQYPEALRDKALNFKLEARIDEAEQCLKLADEHEQERKTEIDKLPNTFFPIKLSSPSFECTKEELLEEYKEDLSHREFYFYTTQERAKVIAINGFDPLRCLLHRVLDSGLGTYLSPDQKTAKWYAGLVGTEDDTFLRVKVAPKGKIALCKPKLHIVVGECFRDIANLFARIYKYDLHLTLQQEGVLSGTVDIDDVATNLAVMNVSGALQNLFTTDFFKRNGYRGVFAGHSTRAGEYLNLYHPDEDIVSITQV